MYKIFDYEIADLIKMARMLRRDSWKNDDYISEYYTSFLQLRRVINTIMKERRSHKKKMAEIWSIYAKSMCKAL